MKFYTMNEVCELLHVSRRTLLTYIQSGQLAATKAGGKWQISEEAVADFTKSGNPQQARDDADLLELYHALTPSRRQAVHDLAQDLQEAGTSSRIQRLTPREQTIIHDYRHLSEQRKEKAEKALRDCVRQEDQEQQWRTTWGDTDPALKSWAMAASGNDPDQAGYLLSMVEDEVNRQLPAGQWFDSRTARPMMDSLDRGQAEDAGTDADTWKAIMDRAEGQALVRLRKWRRRQGQADADQDDGGES